MDELSSTSRLRRMQIMVGMVGLLMALTYAAAELAAVDWDPAGVIAVGEEDAIRIAYAEATFGREIPLAETVGHDGRFFFIQSMDPLLLDPDRNAAFLDRPTYRSQRMLYPALAGLVGPFGPDAVVWAMLVVNVLAFTIGTLGASRLAVGFGLSPWWGLTFAANPGVRFELDIAGGGVVAFAAVVWALYFLRRGRFAASTAAFVLAVLAREVMIVAVAGAALARGAGGLTERLKVLLIPMTAVAGWWIYVQWRVGDLASEVAIQEIGFPFAGFVGAFRLWIQEPGIDMVMGITYLTLSLLMVVRAAKRQTLLELPAAGFGLLALLLTRQVWYRHFDISRAVSPLLTLFLLSLAVSLFARNKPMASIGGDAPRPAVTE